MTRHTFQRYAIAVGVGCAIVAAAGGIASITLVATHHATPHKWEYIQGFIVIGPLAAAAAACVGAAVGASGRAAAYGAILFAALTAQCVWIVGREIGPWNEQLWMWTAACALGGLIGGSGAVFTRTASRPGEEGPRFVLQFTLQELLMLSSLLGVLLSYFAHFVQM